jgi:hypothetical protein
MTDRLHRQLEGLAVLALIVATSSTPFANATPLELAAQSPAEASVDLDLAALLLAGAGIITGIVGWARLRAERPKIVAEIASSNEERLQKALDAAWEEAERLRAIRIRERDELTAALARIAELEAREDELEHEVAALRHRLDLIS